MPTTTTPITPSAQEIHLARESSEALAPLLQDAFARARAHLHVRSEGDREADVVLPPSLLQLLLKALQELAQGHTVALMSVDAELSTQQAADLLRVSRPFLVKLLEEGAMPYRKVGAHRRLLVGDLLAYVNEERHRREQVMAELAAETERLGL